MSIWSPILIFFSLGLLTINFFRFNILFVIAAVFVNIGITQIPGTPLWLIIAAWFLALGEGVAGIVKAIWGKKTHRKRFTG